MRIIKIFLVNLVEYFLCCLMVLLCVDVFVGVFTRYVMGKAVPWSDEVARYLFIWVALLGAAVGVHRRAHFFVHFIVSHFGKRGQFAIEVLSWLLIMGFSVFITSQGKQVMDGVSVQMSPALGLNMSWVFLAVPVHGCLSFIYAGGHLWQAIQSEIKRGKQ